jgi:peptidyl-prolyl cis-trans isomerase SurA
MIYFLPRERLRERGRNPLVICGSRFDQPMKSLFRVIALVLLVAPAVRAETHVVRNTDDSGGGSLREALKDASDGDGIVFASDVHGTITLDDALDVDTDVGIKGPGAADLTLERGDGTVAEVTGTVTISGLTFAGGETGIELKGGRLTLIESAVRDSAGDGITNRGGRLTLVRSQVTGSKGIGVANASGTTTCVNSTIAGNQGSGIAVREGNVSTASCTIARNGGTGLDAGEGEITVQNTLLAANAQGCSGTVRSTGYNLTDDLRCTFAQTGDITSDDPRLGDVANNGGTTQTVALGNGSPAIDAGDPSGCADPSSGGMLTSDQRGVRRPSGGRCDIGAFETQAAVKGTVVNRIMALVDGDPITLYELKDFAAGDQRLKDALVMNQAEVLDLLITKHLIAKEVEKQGIVVQDADVDRYVANIRERNQITDDQLDAALAQQGLSRERYRAQVREELERAQLINREIRGKVSVSPEEIERYYKEHGDDGEGSGGGTRKGSVTISQIFLALPAGATAEQTAAVEARAERIYDELKDGADFAETAKRDSEDGAAKSGGSLGTFKQGEMREDLEKAIADLEPGEFSQPVRGSAGIHIVRLDARAGTDSERSSSDGAIPEGKSDEIKEQLYAKALEERYVRWLKEDLRQRHHVEVRP